MHDTQCQCEVIGCKNSQRQNIITPNIKYLRSPYCNEHSCVNDECMNMRRAGHDTCEKCVCEAMNCGRDASDWNGKLLCYRHKCATPHCMNVASTRTFRIETMITCPHLAGTEWSRYLYPLNDCGDIEVPLCKNCYVPRQLKCLMCLQQAHTLITFISGTSLDRNECRKNNIFNLPPDITRQICSMVLAESYQGPIGLPALM